MNSHPLLAAAGHHRSPIELIVVGGSLIVLFAAWAIWPRSVVRVNNWLAHFRWVRASSATRSGRPVEPSNRRIRIASGVGILVGLAFVVIGLLR